MLDEDAIKRKAFIGVSIFVTSFDLDSRQNWQQKKEADGNQKSLLSDLSSNSGVCMISED